MRRIYIVSYRVPNIGGVENRAFTSKKEAEEFADELFDFGYAVKIEATLDYPSAH